MLDSYGGRLHVDVPPPRVSEAAGWAGTTAPGRGDPTPYLPRAPQQLKVQGGFGMLWPWKYVQGEGQWKQCSPPPQLQGKIQIQGRLPDRGWYCQPISQQQPANSDADLGNSTRLRSSPQVTYQANNTVEGWGFMWPGRGAHTRFRAQRVLGSGR